MRLKVESPLAISSSLSGNINETLDYIPGTVIRGVLADAFLKENDINDSIKKALFNQLFLSEEVIYNNFYIGGSMPVPLTARTCKTFSGFSKYLPKGKFSPLVRDDSHGVKDYLRSFLLYEETGDMDAIKDDCTGISGKDCGLPMERHSGYCLFSSSHGYYDVPVSMREIARTEIFNKTQTSLPGILFTIEVIDEGQVFEGSIEVNNTGLESKLQEYLIREKVFSIGVGKTRGLGRVSIMSEELTCLTTKTPLKDNNGEQGRFSLFNQKIKEMFGLHPSNNNTFFSITLDSDTIIKQEDERYLSLITPDLLGIDNFKLKLSFCSTRKISGWSNVWRLPKRDDIAIAKGSVFLYESKQKIESSKIPSLFDTLERLEVHGIGIRRNEGFGKINICHPFHWRV